jgi:hypothetical protein
VGLHLSSSLFLPSHLSLIFLTFLFSLFCTRNGIRCSQTHFLIESRCCSVKAENMGFLSSTQLLTPHIILRYKINLVSPDNNPNRNSKFPPFHPIKTKKIYQKFPPFPPIPLQTSTPSPAKTPPPPAKLTPPSFAPASCPAPPTSSFAKPTLPCYSDGSPPLLRPRELEKNHSSTGEF